MDDTNPYASPASYESAPPEESPILAELVGPPVWREGDELVVPAQNAVFPRACVLTNRTDGLGQLRSAKGPVWLELVLAMLLVIPFVGLVVAAVAGVTLLRMGFATELRPWVRRPVWLVHQLSETFSVLLFLSANLLSGIAMVKSEMFLLIPGVMCYATALAVVYLPSKMLTRVGARRAEGGILRIRGVHPEYLDRLPEKDEAQGKLWPEGTLQE